MGETRPELPALPPADPERRWRRRAQIGGDDGNGGVGALTPREADVLGRVAEGRSNAEIASLLWISESTVCRQLEHIYEKLGVHSRTAAVARAFVDDRKPA